MPKTQDDGRASGRVSEWGGQASGQASGWGRASEEGEEVHQQSERANTSEDVSGRT